MTIASASSTATHIALTTLFSAVQDAHLLNSTAGILGWDQETMMPNGGAELRSRQLAQLARVRALAVSPSPITLSCKT